MSGYEDTFLWTKNVIRSRGEGICYKRTVINQFSNIKEN